MTAKDAVVIAVTISVPKMTADMSTIIAMLMGITSDMSSASRVGADDGQRINGRQKERASDGAKLR